MNRLEKGGQAEGKQAGEQPNAVGREQQNRTPNRLAERWDSDLWKQQMIDAGLVRQPGVVSRRSFLTGGAALVVGLAVDNIGKFSPLAKWLDDKVVGQFDYDEIVKEAKAYMKERYNVNLMMGREKNREDVLGNPLALDKYRVVLRVITQEMSKYPPELIRKIGEPNGFEVRIVEDLATAGSTTGMSSNNNQAYRLAGLAPALTRGKAAQFILDSSQPEYFLRQTVHHELNHRCATKWENREKRDRQWTDFHAKVSRSPYRRLPAGTKSDTPPKERYFLTQYASSAPVEDEAICAEHMMTPSLMVVFIEKWKNEQDQNTKDILALKYLQTKKNYAVWSEGKMGDAFWQSIIDQGYREKQNTTRKG